MVARQELDREQCGTTRGRAFVVEPAAQQLFLRAPAELTDRAERERALAEVGAARRRFQLIVPLAAQVRELALGARLCELVGLGCSFCQRHARERTAAARRIAAAERRTSSSVVRQFETEIRMACSPFHCVPLNQQVPSSCTRVTTSAGTRTSTWLSMTSLRTVRPPAESNSAKSRACAQQRSTSSAMPS